MADNKAQFKSKPETFPFDSSRICCSYGAPISSTDPSQDMMNLTMHCFTPSSLLHSLTSFIQRLKRTVRSRLPSTLGGFCQDHPLWSFHQVGKLLKLPAIGSCCRVRVLTGSEIDCGSYALFEVRSSDTAGEAALFRNNYFVFMQDSMIPSQYETFSEGTCILPLPLPFACCLTSILWKLLFSGCVSRWNLLIRYHIFA